jgi:hypothetical protein
MCTDYKHYYLHFQWQLTHITGLDTTKAPAKAIETQENKALEMETKDHLQLVATSYVPPALQKVFSK